MDGELTRTSIAIGTRKSQAGRPKTIDSSKPKEQRVNFIKKDLDNMYATVNAMNSKIEELYQHKLNKLKSKELENIELEVSDESEEEQIIVKKKKKPKVIYLESDTESSVAPSEVSTTTDTSESSVEVKKKKPAKKKDTKKVVKKPVKKETKSKKPEKSKKPKKEDSSSSSSDDEYPVSFNAPQNNSRFQRQGLNIF